jgi:hypothetical protein
MGKRSESELHMLIPTNDEIPLEGVKGGEADGTDDGSFDLSGMADLESGSEDGQATQGESTETVAEVSAETPGDDAQSQAPKTFRVGDTEYSDLETAASDLQKLHGAFTRTSQERAQLAQEVESLRQNAVAGQAPTQAQAEATIEKMEDNGGFTQDQIDAAKQLFGIVGKDLGYVSKAELEAQRQEEAYQAQRDQFDKSLDSFVSTHNGSDGLPAADKLALLKYMGDNGIGPQHLESAYKLMHLDAIQQAAAQKFLEKKVNPVQTEKNAPSAGQIPHSEKSVSFDDPDSVAEAMSSILG